LLFVRAGSDKVVAPLDWATCFEKYGAIIEAPLPGEQAQPEAAVGAITLLEPTHHEKASELPTQVVLTEWLQFLRRAFTAVAGGTFRPRIGVVIAAWDAVPMEQKPQGPAPYLRDNFPMLHQFIEANDDQFDFRVFGVSIVDGDLENDEKFKEAYLKGRPQDFGFVMHSLSGQLERSSDITLPVAWALRLLPD